MYSMWLSSRGHHFPNATEELLRAPPSQTSIEMHIILCLPNEHDRIAPLWDAFSAVGLAIKSDKGRRQCPILCSMASEDWDDHFLRCQHHSRQKLKDSFFFSSWQEIFFDQSLRLQKVEMLSGKWYRCAQSSARILVNYHKHLSYGQDRNSSCCCVWGDWWCWLMSYWLRGMMCLTSKSPWEVITSASSSNACNLWQPMTKAVFMPQPQFLSCYY